MKQAQSLAYRHLLCPAVCTSSVVVAPVDHSVVGAEECVWVQAQATQEANRAATNRWPPFWAIAAMVLLGFDEFVAVLYNPLWLLLGLVIFLFGKTVYQASTSAPPSHMTPSVLELR